MAGLPRDVTLVELGSGSANKTRLLIEALLRTRERLRYVPVDISRAALEESAPALLQAFPRLEVLALAAEYEDGLRRLRDLAPGPKLILWLGSNVGNLHRDEAGRFLGRLREAGGAGDRFLLGADLRKSRAVLEPAYDDAAGVTARFNLNLLRRINRELGGGFDPAAFAHRATYDVAAGRIEMHLVSRREQRVRIAALGREFAFAAGEAVHTENSYKYAPAEIRSLAAAGGWRVERMWFDGARRFAESRLAPAEAGP